MKWLSWYNIKEFFYFSASKLIVAALGVATLWYFCDVLGYSTLLVNIVTLPIFYVMGYLLAKVIINKKKEVVPMNRNVDDEEPYDPPLYG